MSTTIRISEEHKELIDDVAEQLGVSRKACLDGILDWFFSDDVGEYEDDEEEEG